jgi:hypothetical protein
MSPGHTGRIAAVLLVVGGCGGPTGVASSPPNPSSPPKPGGAPAAASPYDALFEDGRVVRYKRVSVAGVYDPDDPAADASGNVAHTFERVVTCKVQTRTFVVWKAARLSCDGPPDDDLPLGNTFVADARGIWATHEIVLPPSEEAVVEVAAGRPLLPANPAPVNEQANGDTPSRVSSQTDDGTWCVGDGTWAGDEHAMQHCFRAGAGLTKLGSSWGASTSMRQEWAELIP